MNINIVFISIFISFIMLVAKNNELMSAKVINNIIDSLIFEINIIKEKYYDKNRMNLIDDIYFLQIKLIFVFGTAFSELGIVFGKELNIKNYQKEHIKYFSSVNQEFQRIEEGGNQFDDLIGLINELKYYANTLANLIMKKHCF